MTDVLLATCAQLPAGEEWTGTTYLDEAFVRRGIDARWVVWDDPAVDWSEGLVAVRSTWDYDSRLEEFLAWTAALPRLLNSVEIFRWNTDKAYLTQLADLGVPVVPTLVVEDPAGLPDAVAHFGRTVVKPRVGAGGRGVVVVTEPGGFEAGTGPWVVQPLVESVRTEGETSVFVLDGRVVSQAQKRPAEGEIRVHEQYGGTTVGVPLTPEATALAETASAAAATVLGRPLDYVRVDAMRLADGTLAVSELEATEPGLYLEILPDNAEAFVDLVESRLAER